MEKKRKRIQSTDGKMATRVASSTRQHQLKKIVPAQEEKKKEMNYLNKPHLQFK